jgi:SPP1 gp7 family putative phage head morphogenesis protein
LTYGERRKRADVQLIQKDFDGLESAFLTHAQKLNKKRQAQIAKRVERVIDELQKAHQKGDTEEVEGILASLKMPSSKEWYKLVDKLVSSAVDAGILRAHFELLRLKELYEFDEWEVVNEGYEYDVILPEEARDWLKKYAYEIGVITETTTLNRIRKTLENSLDEGLSPKDTMEAVRNSAGTWMSDFHAQTIARTETAKMYNAGRIARWTDPEQNGFVEALQYDAIVDTRTTELCEHLDGRIVAITNGATIAKFTPPNHFQCRATWIPVTKYEEWEDDWDNSIEPDKGFTFEAPLPKLLKGKKEPLVQPKKRASPLDIKDPDEIRSLDDDDFRLAIGNVTDLDKKLAMINERAEKMAVKEIGLKEKRIAPQFTWYGFNSDANKGSFEIYDTLYEFYMTQEIREDIENLVRALQGASDSEIVKILEEFEKKFIASIAHLDIVRVIREAQALAPVEADIGTLVTVAMTAQATKQLTIKTPPQTKNYKNATGLQQAVKDGQAWMLKHLHPRLAPSSGVQLKFQHDLTRAYAIGSKGTIHFGKYERNAGVVVHEVGHVIHWNNPEIAELIEEFFMKRTDNLKKPKSKRHGEDVIPDDFFNSYIGRIYGWEEHNNKIYKKRGDKMRSYGQEVLSMGLQAMYENPKKFYKDDKEHFLFTYAIMRGLF